MDKNVIVTEREIQQILDENGVIYYSDEADSLVEMDSITFISLIVELEEKFDIEILPEYIIEPPAIYTELIEYLKEAVRMSAERKVV